MEEVVPVWVGRRREGLRGVGRRRWGINICM
jgi:hypothetical protein